jgi:NADH-quinone oxidoreductase subunit F
MIVMDEDTCMVDTARYYINFLAHESCGKCVPCREGLRQMLNILNNITTGNAAESDIDLLEELSEFMKVASLCALGQSAPNMVASTLKHFRKEYLEHIRDKHCSSGVCSALIAYDIDQAEREVCATAP